VNEAVPVKRTRDLGIVVGRLAPGPSNAITDVLGVRLGHVTVDDGASLHTGVTAIVPDQLTAQRPSLPCAVFTGNGHGKLVGSTQVDELGSLETPIVLTATLSVFRAADAVLTYMMGRPGYERVRTLNPLVGETNDGYLSDIRARPITGQHVVDALAGATSGRVDEGCVGAGTGTSALGYKAGIGTASRVVALGDGTATVGALVQANFSGTLQVLGVPLPAEELLVGGDGGLGAPLQDEPPGNSCMIVVATDAAVDARQLGRMARRAVFAMGRVGSEFASGSGDYAIAFSCAEPGTVPVAEGWLDVLFRATVESVEEALLNSLFVATDTVGIDGHRRFAVPHDLAVQRLRAAGRI
jgi:D-aminopeptidase